MDGLGRQIPLLTTAPFNLCQLNLLMGEHLILPRTLPTACYWPSRALPRHFKQLPDPFALIFFLFPMVNTSCFGLGSLWEGKTRQDQHHWDSSHTSHLVPLTLGHSPPSFSLPVAWVANLLQPSPCTAIAALWALQALPAYYCLSMACHLAYLHAPWHTATCNKH